MNDLIRPSFYEAYRRNRAPSEVRKAVPRSVRDVVGPTSEVRLDFFARSDHLPARVGKVISSRCCMQRGRLMASNYNTRPFAAEVLVNGRQSALVKDRQPIAEIWSGEKLAPWQKWGKAQDLLNLPGERTRPRVQFPAPSPETRKRPDHSPFSDS